MRLSVTQPSAPGAPVALCPSLDRPAARVDRVASALSGRVLEYVSPAPLDELLSPLRTIPRPVTDDEDHTPLAIALLPFSGLRGPAAAVDSPQAMRTGEIAFGHCSHIDARGLDALARAIDARNIGLREEIIFAGARSSVAATHVYAPHDDLPERREELVRVLASPPADVDSYLFGVTCGYFASALHPYIAGNGRWSRLVAAQAARRTGTAADAVLAATFLAAMKEPLAGGVWPRAVTGGLREFVTLAGAFADGVRREFAASATLDDTRAVLAVLRPYAPSKRELERVAIAAASRNRLDLATVRTRFALSTRRLDGLAAAIAATCPAAALSPTNVDDAQRRLSDAITSSLESIA